MVHLRYLAISLFTLGFVAGCAAPEQGQLAAGSSVETQIPLYDTSSNSYKFGLVSIFTLNNLKDLSGKAAQFFYKPVLRDGRMDGLRPDAKVFLNGQGQLVASDLKSLELVTLYYHFEQLMFLDQKVGIGTLNPWPRSVGLEAKVVDKFQKISKNNARYSPQADAYLFESFISPNLNLTVNAGVIAHEHFHATFYRLALLPLASIILPPSPHGNAPTKDIAQQEKTELNRQYLEATLRAWNEGLADVWGWIYSQDSSFVLKSIPSEKGRDLNGFVYSVPSKQDFESLIGSTDDGQTRMEYAYRLGGLLARIAYQVTQTNKNSPKLFQNEAPPITRLDLAKAITQILPGIALEVKKDQKPSPSLPLILLSQHTLLKSHCQELLAAVPDGDLTKSKEELCATL